MLDFYIGYEVGKPHRIFLYKPVKISTNLLTIELVEPFPLERDKEYQFYFRLGKNNFSLTGIPIKVEKNRAVLLIRDSSIELRRYPRVYLTTPDVKVKVNNLAGYLKDISLGGCRVHFKKPIPRAFYMLDLEKVLEITVPGYEPIKVKGRVVNISDSHMEASFVFKEKSPEVVRLHKLITEYIEKSGQSYEKV